ncbi:MAG TPA: 16S rRNA (guanine(527)-N(7))-methyltransferase RsmG [Thermomicrobiales bacterium]
MPHPPPPGHPRRGGTGVYPGAGVRTDSDASPAEAASVPRELPPSVREHLIRYRDLLLEWNQRHNLTALTTPEEVDARLVAESLRLLPAIDAYARERRDKTGRLRLIDIGSGAGVPGLILAIARPDLFATLVEATGKKVAFLDAAIADLGLDNVRAIHARAEDLARDPAHRERYDLATARAVGPVPTLLELALPFLRVGGRALFPKGPDLGTELAEGERAAKTLGGQLLSADLLPDDPAWPDLPVTRLVVAAKLTRTPHRYPRRAGIPAKEPLGRVDR